MLTEQLEVVERDALFSIWDLVSADFRLGFLSDLIKVALGFPACHHEFFEPLRL